MRRFGITVLIGLLLTATATTSAHAAAADTTPPQLRSITLSEDTVTVAGTAVKFVDVDVRLTDDVGVVEGRELNYFFDPILTFPNFSVQLALSSGTPQDGVWSGIAPVTSEWRGAVQPISVVARDEAQNKLVVDPRTVIDTPTLTVHSSNTPAVEITLTPNPAVPNSAITLTVRSYNRDTRQFWPGLPIAVGVDNSCPEDVIDRATARTDIRGYYRQTLPAGQMYDFVYCAWVPAANAPGQPSTRIGGHAANVTYQYKYAVTAAPAAASVPAGTNVEVNGHINPPTQRKTVHLQRLYGTEWRTVNSGATRPSGRFTILATPPGVGLYRYRVYAPGQTGITGNTSATFTIRGT